MLDMKFEGQLLSAVEGVNAKEYGGAPYTVLEFSAVGEEVFKLRADGHIAADLSKTMRKDVVWALGVTPKTTQGKVGFKVGKIAVVPGK